MPKSKWPYYKTDQFCIYANCRIIPHDFWPLSLGSCCCRPKSSRAPSTHSWKYDTQERKQRPEIWEWISCPRFKKKKISSLGWKSDVWINAWQCCSKNRQKAERVTLMCFMAFDFFPALSNFYSTRISPTVCDTKTGSSAKGFAWR